MPFPIQRVPRGLGTLLSTFGGLTPRDLADQVAGTLELLQFYGLTQWQLRSNANAALTQGNAIDIPVPLNEWWVLFSANALVLKTATQTALRMSISLGADANSMSRVAYADLGPYGAAPGVGAGALPWAAPYPRLLPPGSIVRTTLDALAGDANANCSINCSVGVLG